jgi:transcriptional regulator with XRE-family HTH domain
VRPLTTTEIGLLGKRLQSIRKAKGMSQAQVSTASGVSIDTLTRLENGKGQEPKLSTVIALAEALEVELSDLVPVKGPRLDEADDLVTHIRSLDEPRRQALRVLLGLSD